MNPDRWRKRWEAAWALLVIVAVIGALALGNIYVWQW
jgi:hypothetical protein